MDPRVELRKLNGRATGGTNRSFKLRNERVALLRSWAAYVDDVEAGTAAERREARPMFHKAERALRLLNEQIAAEERGRPAFDPGELPMSSWMSPATGVLSSSVGDNPNVLRPDQKLADWTREHRPAEYRGLAGELAADGERASLGKFVRGIVTGSWNGAHEERALVEGTNSAGGYLTPEPLASRFIDRVRANMRVIQAGASTVPLTSDVENFPRLTGGATVGWKAEGNAITPSDMVFDRLSFAPKTLPILVLCSAELFADMTPESAAGIEHEMAQALSLEIDRACLRGDGTSNSPTGVRSQSGVALTSNGANGSAITWDMLIDAAAVVRNASIDPSGVILAPRSIQSLQKAKDSQGRFLATPAPFNTSASDAIPIYTSAQVPINLTVGSSVDCSEAYSGRWSDLWLGIRTDMRLDIKVLEERYADNLQVGLLCYVRVDVQLAHAASFNVSLGLRP
jgi:HK97 family phage major capsid protein